MSHWCRRILAPKALRRAIASSSSSSTTTMTTTMTTNTFHFGPRERYAFKKAQTQARAEATAAASATAGRETVDKDEVAKFRALSSSWWDQQGWLKSLHSMNELRVQLVRDGLANAGRVSSEQLKTSKPLEGLEIMDVGCGGGILCEPLARLGAKVTGLEPAEESLRVAREHARADPEVDANLQYFPLTAEAFARENPGKKFDAVVASEVIEHVCDPELFVSTCCDLSRGSLFFTTINRTRQSYLAAVVAAECVLGLLPAGTHDWEKFVEPQELTAWLENSGAEVRLTHGMFYWPVLNTWSWIPQTTVNYALHALKKK